MMIRAANLTDKLSMTDVLLKLSKVHKKISGKKETIYSLNDCRVKVLNLSNCSFKWQCSNE